MIDQKRPENVEYFSYLVSMITNDVKATSENKSRVRTPEAEGFFTNELDVKFKGKNQ